MVNNPQKVEPGEFYHGNITTSADDGYENEFERVMEEQEKDETSTSCDMLSGGCGGPSIPVIIECDTNNQCSTPTISDSQKYTKPDNNVNRANNKLKEINASVKISPTLHTSIEYPSELNPFGDDESNEVQQPETDSEISKNPFGDCEEEETAGETTKSLMPPKPAPRRSPCTRKKALGTSASSNPFWEDGVEPDEDAEKTRLPISLPRTTSISKSMPSTPDQSPLLRLSRSFRQPGSGPLSGSGAWAYYSMRRNKKHAPAPPTASPPSTVLSGAASTPTPTEAPRSENGSPRTPARPRRTRPASPPPLVVPDVTSPQPETGSPTTLTRSRKARPAPPPPFLKSST